jgi:hypothetical protein
MSPVETQPLWQFSTTAMTKRAQESTNDTDDEVHFTLTIL